MKDRYDHLRKINEARRGKPLSDEVKAKLSRTMTGRKRGSAWNSGKNISDEHRAKIKAGVLRAKAEGRLTGNRTPRSEEWKQKNSARNLGRKHSDESRLKR